MMINFEETEQAALRGASRLLAEDTIGMPFLELNWSADRENCPATQALALLHANGYKFSAPTREPEWRSMGPWLNGLSDVMASRQGSVRQ